MHALTATELLGAWERGLSLPPSQRASVLLALAGEAAGPDAATIPGKADSPDAPALTIGRRDARLLVFHAKVFGPEMSGMVTCPACASPSEICFNVADIRLPEPPETGGAFVLNVGEMEVRFRLPSPSDLEALPVQSDPHAAKRALFERCLLSACSHGADLRVDELPDEVVEAVSAQMAALDPQGNVIFDLACPQCNHRWQAPLDILSFLWSEIHAWAIRLLREVHALASAYGWREADILAMSPQRRQIYLQMIAP